MLQKCLTISLHLYKSLQWKIEQMGKAGYAGGGQTGVFAGLGKGTGRKDTEKRAGQGGAMNE